MSEYQERQSIFRFIGTPDGEKSGSLTDAVLRDPYSLILFDEFEKAHPDILNLFLQVLDDGRLTDGMGRTVNFENTIIIATSNAHSDFIKREIEKKTPSADLAEMLKAKLTEIFRPELINRFSDIVAFRPLKQDEIEIVASRLIAALTGTIGETHGITLSVDSSAIKKIAEIGYSPVFGARPLRQAISENIRSVLAEKLLKKEIGRGNSVTIQYEAGAFSFRVVE
jgi:ATP-dependent Clp protease ATP-binding subunit ClpB